MIKSMAIDFTWKTKSKPNTYTTFLYGFENENAFIILGDSTSYDT